MRRTLAILGLALATAAPALAQSAAGRFGLDAMVAPTTSLGAAYYFTDGLSLRPWLGLGYSDYAGFYGNVGAQVRYELAARSRLSPYVSATAQFSHYGSSGVTTVPRGGSVTGQQMVMANNLGQFGSGFGARYRISDSLAAFGEGRVMYTTSPTGTTGGWATATVNDHTRVDAVIGLTYLFGGGGHGGHHGP
jgi:hypothetical protein